MKPQNYSLKFQNSLADCRITPGSQHGSRASTNSQATRNGQRSLRKLTKYQQSLVNRGISKNKSKPASLKPANNASKTKTERIGALIDEKVAEIDAKEDSVNTNAVLKSEKPSVKGKPAKRE